MYDGDDVHRPKHVALALCVRFFSPFKLLLRAHVAHEIDSQCKSFLNRRSDGDVKRHVVNSFIVYASLSIYCFPVFFFRELPSLI